MMKPKILIVGSGITGSVLGKLLRLELENVELTMWEKDERPGGRFYTIQRNESAETVTDLGAQYITTTKETMKCFETVYSELLSKTLIQTMKISVKGMKDLGTEKINYIAKNGMGSIINYFLDEAKLNSMLYNHELRFLNNKKPNKWSAITSLGKEEAFDIVVLTVPPPEILKLEGDIETILTLSQKDSLSSVTYSSRYAMGLFFDQDVQTEYDSEYIDNNILRFIAYDKWRRNRNAFRSAVLHTSVKFNEHTSPDYVENIEGHILKSAKALYPHWPDPTFVQTYSWKYSQVTLPFFSKPGGVVLNVQPLLLAGGDGFIGSTFDQCLRSARVLCDIIVSKYKVK